ncbi:hypothetical protein BMF94_3301 [Rhodotorula taiwanensis]|uniref:HSF-type DNA-binding domain-containing protein n=1 Tax=Rhodotorula taiwanensis TaxID=741276 RepID=A0A2S5BAG3_9BASI|nr:hypothetical protein BMF94_3301 [Rhodotorula taiwanensis]
MTATGDASPATIAAAGEPRPASPHRDPTNALSPAGSVASSSGQNHAREGVGEDERDELEEDGDDAASSDARSRSVEPGASAPPSRRASDSGLFTSMAIPSTGKTQASFVHKVWGMLEDPALRQYIAWSEDGKSFLVFNPVDFARDVLPRFFKHSNFSSFLRQCNFYNWSKVNDALSHTNSFAQPGGAQSQAWEFRNPSFQRGRPDLLAKIKRKTAKSSSAPTPAVNSRRRTSVTSLASSTRANRPGSSSRPNDTIVDTPDDISDRDEAPTKGPNHRAGETRDGDLRGSDYNFPAARKPATTDDVLPYLAANGRAPKEEEGSPPQTQTRRPRSGPLNDEAPYFYTQAGPIRYSPGTRPYPLPGSSSYSSYRHSLAEETTTRHVRALEHQVRVMGEVLHQEQHEHATTRATSYSVLQSLIEAVAGLDKDGRYHAELQAAHRALHRFESAPSPPSALLSAFATQQHHSSISWPGASSSSNGYSMPNGYSVPAGYSSSLRPGSASQFYYNRVPAVESYTRTARPDSRPVMPSHSDLRPASSGSPFDPNNGQRSPPEVESLRHSVRNETAGSPTGGVGRGPEPNSVGLRKSYVVSAFPPSGCLAPIASAHSSGTNESHEVESDRNRGANAESQLKPRTLPPLSSLLNPIGPPSSHVWSDRPPGHESPAHSGERSPKRARY